MASTYRTPNSWGRTRRPKELYQHLPGDQRQAPSKVEVTTLSDLNGNLNDATEGQNGYSTENQKFLHVFVKHSSAAQKTVAIYGFNYAFGEWAPLLISLGNATNTAATASTGGSGENRMYIFDVSGVDRVAFVASGTDAPSRVRAACSTF